MNQKYHYIFFGTSEFSVIVLEEMKTRGFLPSIIVTSPDKAKGRKMVITPPDAKVWAEKNGIPVMQPQTLRDAAVQEAFDEKKLGEHEGAYLGSTWDFFVVASYGHILPKKILDIPEYGVLNIHPSLLPRFRGASPIQESILHATETGVSIMLMDEELDHGPVLAQEKLTTKRFPLPLPLLEEKLALLGSHLLCESIPKWISADIVPIPQDEGKATFTKKISKNDAEIDLENGNSEENYRKILAFSRWPKAFFFIDLPAPAGKSGKKMRVVVKDAQLQNGELKLLTVIPEGRGKMTGVELKKWTNRA